jgi:hypothetical protein
MHYQLWVQQKSVKKKFFNVVKYYNPALLKVDNNPNTVQSSSKFCTSLGAPGMSHKFRIFWADFEDKILS